MPRLQLAVCRVIVCPGPGFIPRPHALSTAPGATVPHDSAPNFPRFRAMARPLYAEVNLAALRANLALVRRSAPDAQVLAVVKANAYGHGLQRILPELAA